MRLAALVTLRNSWLRIARRLLGSIDVRLAHLDVLLPWAGPNAPAARSRPATVTGPGHCDLATTDPATRSARLRRGGVLLLPLLKLLLLLLLLLIRLRRVFGRCHAKCGPKPEPPLLL